MDDLSLHILDVAENSVNAGATMIQIRIDEDPQADQLSIEIADNGHGMDAKTVLMVLDPFMTTKKHKRVGLGLPLFADSAREAGGDIQVESTPGQGTRVMATMKYHHIDRKPLGDLVGTFMTLAVGSPQADFYFIHSKAGRDYSVATWDLKKETRENTISSARAIRALREALQRGEASLG